jgi:Domain of unknown function (DUF4389)
MVCLPTCRAIGRKWGFLVTSDPYQAYPSFPAGAPLRLVEEPAVQLIAVGPHKQRRLTVAFRAILCIPHSFVLAFLNLAGVVVAFLGWWGALFMGRLPAFAVRYLSGLARWNARYYGYFYLLTDDYPPFKFEDDPVYPVVIAIPPPGRLNRFAVFFRFILMTWANIVSGLVIYGASTIVAFIAWLITLITGKLPTPLHLAFTAVLRFQTRYACYAGLLTSTYPWKLFGDEPEASAPVTAAPAETVPSAESTETATPAESPWGTPPGSWGAPPAGWTSPAYGTPPAYGPGYDTTLGYGTPASGYGAPYGYGSAQPASQPADWRLILPQSAKILLIVFIVLGLITDVGLQVARFASTDKAANSLSVKTTAISQWNSAFTTLKTEMAQDPTSNCGQSLSCYTKADSHFAAAMNSFANQVQAITMPPAAAPDANTVVADAEKAAQDFTQLSHVTDMGLYEGTYTGLGAGTELQRFSQDVANFGTALSSS